MALRISKALRNFMNNGGSLRQALNGGKITFFTGAQPATADDAEIGTPLAVFTVGAAAHTNEVLAAGGTTLLGSAGSLTALTVNGLEIMGSATAFNTDLDTTAADVCRKINKNPRNLLFKATHVGAVITITAKPGLGALANGWVVSPTGSGGITLTGTANLSGGVYAVNGLTWEAAAAGVMAKNTDEAWEAVGIADGTAGWFRWTAGVADAGAADSDEEFIRLDGTVAASGAQLNGATSIATGAPQTISQDQINIPAA